VKDCGHGQARSIVTRRAGEQEEENLRDRSSSLARSRSGRIGGGDVLLCEGDASVELGDTLGVGEEDIGEGVGGAKVLLRLAREGQSVEEVVVRNGSGVVDAEDGSLGDGKSVDVGPSSVEVLKSEVDIRGSLSSGGGGGGSAGLSSRARGRGHAGLSSQTRCRSHTRDGSYRSHALSTSDG
jgi:hypothetical protein